MSEKDYMQKSGSARLVIYISQEELQTLDEWVLKSKYGKIDPKIFPFRSRTAFARAVVKDKIRAVAQKLAEGGA